jgi:hypothetical protein
MSPYPRISSFNIDPVRFSAMIEEFRAYSETEEKKMPNDYEEMEQESRLYPWLDLAMTEEYYDEEWDEEDWDDEMDGDWDSGMSSAGWGTDEDYGYYGEDF